MSVVGDALPQTIVDVFWPSIAIAIEAPRRKRIGQGVQRIEFGLFGLVVPQCGGAVVFQAERGLRIHIGQLVQAVWAQIAATAFGQGETQFQATFFHHKRQIAVDQLFLQGDGGAGDDEFFLTRLRHDAASEQISQALAHASWPFDDGDAFTIALDFLVFAAAGFAAAKGVGYRCQHFPLRRARSEIGQVLGYGFVMVGNGVFFEVGEHGHALGWRKQRPV